MTVQIVTSLRDRGGKVVPESYADMLDGTNALVLATVAGGAGDRFISAGRDRGNAAIAERWADQGDGTFARVVSLAAGSGGGFTAERRDGGQTRVLGRGEPGRARHDELGAAGPREREQ